MCLPVFEIDFKMRFVDSGALFSPCKKYRYLLWRVWDAKKPLCTFIMLNPSTADWVQNDPTIERCVRRVKTRGHGGLVVANLFAYRSTDPSALYKVADPVGPDNDKHILEALENYPLGSSTVVCAWGTHGNAIGMRGDRVLKLIRNAGRVPMHLGLNKDGSPKHPLYTSYDVDFEGMPAKSRIRAAPSYPPRKEF